MMGEVTTLVVSAMMAAVSGPLGAWLNSKVMRTKYRAEVEKLRGELDAMRTADEGNALENVRKATEILMEGVVTPLRAELKGLRNEINRMRKAIEKIPSCPHADSCPVSRELLDEEPTDGEPDGKKRK